MVRLLITSGQQREWKSIVRLMTAPVDEFCARPASFLPMIECHHSVSMGMHNEGTLMSPISSDYEKQSIYISMGYILENILKKQLNEKLVEEMIPHDILFSNCWQNLFKIWMICFKIKGKTYCLIYF